MTGASICPDNRHRDLGLGNMYFPLQALQRPGMQPRLCRAWELRPRYWCLPGWLWDWLVSFASILGREQRTTELCLESFIMLEKSNTEQLAPRDYCLGKSSRTCCGAKWSAVVPADQSQNSQNHPCCHRSDTSSGDTTGRKSLVLSESCAGLSLGV